MLSSVLDGSHKHSTSDTIGCGGMTRKPLQLLTGFFSRKTHPMTEDKMPQSPVKEGFYISDDVDAEMWDSLSSEEIPEPREALHSPYHARTIDQDMENLRLSRQDNPFLQVLASRECLNESDDGSEYEEKHLMSKENLSGSSRDPLSIAEVHARLVRSPPPIMWTKSRNSEPSFSRFTSHNSSLDAECVFQFPPPQSSHGRFLLRTTEPSPTHSCRSHASSIPQGHTRFLGPFKKDATLEALTARFNLSPQPRRRPDIHKTSRPFSEFSSS